MTALDIMLPFAFCIASLMAFCLMGVDKARAKRGRYRIPERALLVWCACLGALGGHLGMRVFRHKTRHSKFTIAVPVLMILQLALLIVYFTYWRG